MYNKIILECYTSKIIKNINEMKIKKKDKNKKIRVLQKKKNKKKISK